jgi:hypothetical protein
LGAEGAVFAVTATASLTVFSAAPAGAIADGAAAMAIVAAHGNIKRRNPVIGSRSSIRQAFACRNPPYP